MSLAVQKGAGEVTLRPTGCEHSLVRQQNTGATLVAPTRLEASLLRAVTSSTVLKRLGVSFRSQEFGEQTYQKSFATERIGDFISHDWASSRLGKLLALGLVYNSRAALIASAITAVTLACLQYGSNPVLPTPVASSAGGTAEEISQASTRGAQYGFWCMAVSYPVFAVFFLFWQDFRCVLKLGTRTCFLDKYCIDQTDADRKAAGIFGLAGFLRCSERIIILWTPRYFTRLWCTYEVATWLYLQKPMTSVLFMPLAHASILIWIALAGWFSFMTLIFTTPYFPQFYLHFVVASLLVGLSFGAHNARHSAAHLRAIQAQLSSFSLRSSNCFCCTAGHVQNGEEIPCDRLVVYATIADWFNNAGDDGPASQEAALDRFDQAVRTQFAGQVLQKAGPTQLSYRYAMVTGWAYMFRLCDTMAAATVLPTILLVNQVIMYVTIVFISPLWYKLAMRMACCMDLWVGIPRWFVLDCALSVVLGFLWTLVALSAYVPLEYAVTGFGSSLPMTGLSLFLVTMCAVVYRGDFRECFCQRRNERPSSVSSCSDKASSILSEPEHGKELDGGGGEVKDKCEDLEGDIFSVLSI